MNTGACVGVDDGIRVGSIGLSEGMDDGFNEGSREGPRLGEQDGDLVDGSQVLNMLEVGLAVGADEG